MYSTSFIKKAVTLGLGGVAGGVGSVLAGGSFMFGAAQGAITTALNHLSHVDPPVEETWSEKVERLAGVVQGKTTAVVDYLIDSQTEKFVAMEMGFHFGRGLKHLGSEFITRISNGQSIQYIHIDMAMPVVDYKNGKFGFYDLNNYSQSELISIRVTGLTFKLSLMKIIGVQNKITNFIGDKAVGYGTGEFINEIEK